VSTKKYFGDRGGPLHNNERLHWPGTSDGFPVVGGAALPPDLKKEELDSLDLRLDFKSKMFELWDPIQKAEFDDVNDKIVNGWFLLQRRNDNWAPEHNHFRVWLEWAQVYGMLPPKAAQ
jgi:hypothetical protein